jgi:hypothetical protein
MTERSLKGSMKKDSRTEIERRDGTPDPKPSTQILDETNAIIKRVDGLGCQNGRGVFLRLLCRDI